MADPKPGPKEVRDPLQAAVRVLLALVVALLVGVAVWALFFRTAEVADGAAHSPPARTLTL